MPTKLPDLRQLFANKKVQRPVVYLGLFLSGVISAVMVNDAVIIPATAKFGAEYTNSKNLLIAHEKVRKGDRSQLATIKQIAENNNWVAYLMYLADLRAEAFKEAGINRDNYTTLLSTVDTHEADKLLLDARQHLDSENLYFLLHTNRELFHPKSRLESSQSIEHDSKFQAYHSARSSHTSLSETERNTLFDCFTKVEALKTEPATFGVCSGSYTLPESIPSISTYSVLKSKLIGF